VDDVSAAVWTVVTDLYRAYLDSDRPRLEAHLAEDCTLWETAAPSLRTKSDVQAAHHDRPPDEPQPLDLIATNPRIRVWGDTASETHELRAVFPDASLDQQLRCSSVLRRTGGRWLFVHHHEELLPPGPAPPA